MNIALEHTEEYVNGVKKNEYGDAFIRGNNGKPHPPSSELTLPPCQTELTDAHSLPPICSAVHLGSRFDIMTGHDHSLYSRIRFEQG